MSNSAGDRAQRRRKRRARNTARRIGYLAALFAVAVALSGCAGKAVPLASLPAATSSEPRWDNLQAEAKAALARGDRKQAIALFEQARQLQPEDADTLFQLGKLYAAAGDSPKARAALSRGLTVQEDIDARNLLGYLEEREGNFQRAAIQYEKVREEDPQNLYALVHLGLAYRQLGKAREAIDILKSARALDPDNARPETRTLDYYLGLAYEDVQEWQQALDAYKRAAQRMTDEPTIPRRITALTAKLAATTPEPVPPVRILPDDISERIRAAPTRAEYPNADAVILLNRSEHEILRDGRSRFTTHQLIKLFTRRAIADYGEVAIPFSSTSQNIAVNVARTILPDGTTIPVSESAIRDVTPPETLSFNLYSDTLWKVISYPALDEGVIVEYQVTVEDAVSRGSTENMWFWGGMTFQNKYPTIESEYALRVPAGVDFKWKAYHAELRPEVESVESPEPGASDQDVRTVWRYGATSAYVPETHGPPPEAILPRFAFSSVTSWDTIHDWYRGLLADRVVPDVSISEMTARLIADATTQDERLRALAHFVARKTRYVAIQLGQGAYQPHVAAEVLRNRYGDCKDKVTLLGAMLQGIGIESYPALINPSPGPDADRSLPSLGEFSHMIVAIPDARAPSGYLWFDPTDDTLPFGRLPARDEGRTALLITPNGPVWETTPLDAPDANRTEESIVLRLDPAGGVKGKASIVATGTHASDRRIAYGRVPPAQMGAYLQQTMAANYPGVTVEAWTVNGLDDLDAPVVRSVEFRIPSYGTHAGSTWIVPLPGADLDSYAALVTADRRTQPLSLGVPNTLTRTITIRLPDDYSATYLPPPISETTPFAAFRRSYRAAGGQVIYEMTLRIEAPVVPVVEYADAKRLFERLAREERAALVLSRDEEAAALPTPNGGRNPIAR